jgi:hypothetical protein
MKLLPIAKIRPQNVERYRNREAAFLKFAEHAAPEAFKWLGWSAAIAAVQVVAIRTDVWWLRLVSWPLFFVVAARILRAVHRPPTEIFGEEGELILKDSVWSFCIGGLVSLLAYLISFELPALIAQSDLLPK